MSLGNLDEAPQIVSAKADIVPFVPSVSFGYLYITQGTIQLLYFAIISTIIGAFIFTIGAMDDSETGHIEKELVSLSKIAFIPWFGSYPFAAWLVFRYQEIERGVIKTPEVVGTSLIILNVGVTVALVGKIYSYVKIKRT